MASSGRLLSVNECEATETQPRCLSKVAPETQSPWLAACQTKWRQTVEFFDQLTLQSLYKILLCICMMYTQKEEINTPSYLCVDVGQIRPNHVKSLVFHFVFLIVSRVCEICVRMCVSILTQLGQNHCGTPRHN